MIYMYVVIYTERCHLIIEKGLFQTINSVWLISSDLAHDGVFDDLFNKQWFTFQLWYQLGKNMTTHN